MDPLELAHLIRSLTASVAGLVAGFWLYIGWKATRLGRRIRLSTLSIWLFSAFFLLLFLATLAALYSRRGQALGTPIVLTVLALALMVGLTATVLRDVFWEEGRRRSRRKPPAKKSRAPGGAEK
jgi:MFS family permease